MELARQTRGRLTLAGLAILFLGFKWWYPDHFRLVFVCLVVFYVLMYIAGGGRLPWKIKFRDYLAYLLISLGIVGFFAAHRALRTAQDTMSDNACINSFGNRVKIGLEFLT